MHLNQNDIDNLKLLSDKGALEGHSEGAARLRELLDAYQEREALAGSAEDANRRKEAMEQTVNRIAALKLSRREDPDGMEVEDLRAEVEALREELKGIHDSIDEEL